MNQSIETPRASAFHFHAGLRPGSYATNLHGLTSVEAQRGLALPHPTPPDAVYVVTPRPGTWIGCNPCIEPRFGHPGGLPEYCFPHGTEAGTVSAPRPLP
ncbi:MAG: hypothetical protein ABSH53_17485 [Holophaga sp.]|jgi:hypothetical protein